MANTAAVYARIDPQLKNDAEKILFELGLTPSAVVQMLYSQIKLTRSVPFEIKLPPKEPLSVSDLTAEQLIAELQKGIDSVRAGRVVPVDEVDGVLNKEFGI
ncbi:MAG: type II toxin-antitoxin system RelB/DinJ family antitoxin [Clostridia bacterium]|jgi:addiction module RelB/DinJ family antitoxin|nr:type II toxin-antitoxin system RelB/DinJ family antitoxin [Clostridia bacterium]